MLLGIISIIMGCVYTIYQLITDLIRMVKEKQIQRFLRAYSTREIAVPTLQRRDSTSSSSDGGSKMYSMASMDFSAIRKHMFGGSSRNLTQNDATSQNQTAHELTSSESNSRKSFKNSNLKLICLIARTFDSEHEKSRSGSTSLPYDSSLPTLELKSPRKKKNKKRTNIM